MDRKHTTRLTSSGVRELLFCSSGLSFLNNNTMKEAHTIDDIHTVVRRLTGNIRPIGDSGIDDVRYDNLIDTIELTEQLLDDIILVAANKGSHEHSVSRAGIEADNFITHLREKLTA